jgi:hypothetical protein
MLFLMQTQYCQSQLLTKSDSLDCIITILLKKVGCLFKGGRSIQTYKEKESGIENLAINLYILTVSDPKSNSHKVSFAAFKLISNPHSSIRK